MCIIYMHKFKQCLKCVVIGSFICFSTQETFPSIYQITQLFCKITVKIRKMPHILMTCPQIEQHIV